MKGLTVPACQPPQIGPFAFLAAVVIVCLAVAVGWLWRFLDRVARL